MIQVGEESGALDAMLLKTADTFEQETALALDRMLAALVPVVTVVLAAVVGIVDHGRADAAVRPDQCHRVTRAHRKPSAAVMELNAGRRSHSESTSLCDHRSEHPFIRTPIDKESTCVTAVP